MMGGRGWVCEKMYAGLGWMFDRVVVVGRWRGRKKRCVVDGEDKVLTTSLWSERWNDSNPMKQFSLSRCIGDWQSW